MRGIGMKSGKKRKGKVGITFGSFDFVHAGHCLMFEECKKKCDYLIVGLQSDPTLDRPEKNKPIMTKKERFIMLSANRFVDYIIPYDTEADLLNILDVVKPDVRFLGKDHKGKPFTGDKLKIPIIFNSRNHNYSSTDIRNRIKASL